MAVAALAAVAAACSADPARPALPPAAPTGTSAAGPGGTAVAPDDRHSARPDPATRPADRARAGVYDAYLAWLRAYLGAYAAPDARADPLAAVATPGIRAGVRAQVARMVALGYAEYGPVTVSPRVTAVAAGRSARVQSCLDLRKLAMRDAFGRLDYYESLKLAITTFIWSNGRWLVTSDEKRSVTRC